MTNEKILIQKQAWKKYRDNDAKAIKAVRNMLRKDVDHDYEDKDRSCIRGLVYAFMITALGVLFFIAGCMLSAPAYAGTIDMHKIMMIESGGRNIPSAIKSEHAAGLYQITPVVMKEFNDSSMLSYEITHEDLYNTTINRYVAQWYLTKRIPQMLRAYKKPVTVRNILIAYNAGISYVVQGKKLPAVTIAYLRKYGVS